MRVTSASTVLLLLLPLLLPLASQAQPRPIPAATQKYSVDRWTIEDGLPNNALAALLNSRDGYLWIATLAGMGRFDGVRFEQFLDALPNAHGRTLLEDRNGNVWIGLDGGGLARVKDGHVDSIPGTQLAGVNVRTLAEDATGHIWAGTENGISIVETDRQIKTLRAAQGLPGNEVRSLAASRAPGNGIWIATDEGLCEGRDTASSVTFRCASRPQLENGKRPWPQPAAVVEDRKGIVWVGSSAGLFSKHTDFSAASPCAEACFPGRSVTALLEARPGSISGDGIWVGFREGGVAFLGHGHSEEYGSADGLIADPVVALTEDAEGSLWIGAYNGGLERLRPKRVRMYSTAEGLPVKAVGSIVQDAAGTIWAGTQCGHISELRDGRFSPRFVEYTKGSCAWSLWPARDGALWIGTYDNGLFRWSQNRMEHFGPAEGLADVHVMALFEDRNGVLWIGTELGGLQNFAKGHLSRAYHPADGVAPGQIDSFAQDRQGRLWIGSNGGGLSVYENGRFRILPPEESPPDRDTSGLFVDSHDDLWVMTDHSGTFRRKNNRFQPFGVRQGLPDQLVALMLEDHQGTFWVSSVKGISRITRDKIEAVAEGRATSLDPIVVDRSDGMLNTEVSGGGFDPTGLLDRQGRLWFSTVDGIAMIDPTLFRTNPVVPRVEIAEAMIAGDAVPLVNSKVEVPAGGPELELRYTTFSMLVPGKVKFKYRLLGLESDWEEAGTRRTAYYPHLGPGIYTFEVMAANNDGLWSKSPARIEIVVAPFWWERKSVRAAALFLLLFLTGFMVQLVSSRRAASRVAELERQGALDRERTRIAQDIHDDLGSRLTRMALMADDTSSGRGEMLATAAREAIQAMDELVWTVNTGNDTVDGFVSYAVAYAEEYLHAARIRVRVNSSADMPSSELDSETRRHLFLCFKEALNNVVKHSGATEVQLAFEAGDRTLHIHIADNGRGFDTAKDDPTGNGLRGMRARFAGSRGRCEIESSPGAGCRVHIHVSLQR